MILLNYGRAGLNQQVSIKTTPFFEQDAISTHHQQVNTRADSPYPYSPFLFSYLREQIANRHLERTARRRHFCILSSSSIIMKDYLKLTFYAALTVVLLCLIRSGNSYPGPDRYMDYKRDTPITTAIRSAKLFDKDDLLELMNGQPRDRSYLTGEYITNWKTHLVGFSDIEN